MRHIATIVALVGSAHIPQRLTDIFCLICQPTAPHTNMIQRHAPLAGGVTVCAATNDTRTQRKEYLAI